LEFRRRFGKSCPSEEPRVPQKGLFSAGFISDVIWLKVPIKDIRHKLRRVWEEVGVAYNGRSYDLLGGTE